MRSTQKEKKDGIYEEHPFNQEATEEYVQEANRIDGNRILVAGCGASPRIFDLVYKNGDVTAIDQSGPAIQFLRSSFEQLPVDSPELINADLSEFDYPKDEFDLIFCIGVLHHMTDPDAALDGFKRALKPDGTARLWVYNRKAVRFTEHKLMYLLTNLFPIGKFLPESVKRDIKWWDNFRNPVVKPYTEDEFRDLVTRFGFEIEDVSYDNHVFGLPLRLLLPEGINYFVRQAVPKRRCGMQFTVTPE